MRNILCRLLISLFFLFLVGCSAGRKPIPPGVIPEQVSVAAEDEQYGQQVLAELTDNYKLDTDDARINRTRDIVGRLADAANAGKNPWNVYVLFDNAIKNAAATRGNYIFVWTGMVNAVQNDDELAAILAHEMGHVLAQHTMPDPMEEISGAISGIAGSVAGQVISARGGPSILAELGEDLVKASINALISNPEQQRKELEADQIGLFLMADARYNPQHAADFWQRVKTDPDFQGNGLLFFSTHPSSEERLKQIQKYLPDAIIRYEDSVASRKKAGKYSNSSNNGAKRPQSKKTQKISSGVY